MKVIVTVPNRAIPTGAILIAILLVCCQPSYASKTRPAACSLTLWSALPANTRQTGEIGGIRQVELSEEIPQQFALDEPFNGWLVIPIDNQDSPKDFIFRAVHYSLKGVTPAGTYHLGVKSTIMAKRSGSEENGLLTLICFDPTRKGELKYPLPEVFKAAREQRLLTARQESVLSSPDESLKQRYAWLVWKWRDFSQGTYAMHARRELFKALTELYASGPGTDREALSPENFFDRSKRTQLRRLGHQIRGRCFILFGRDGFRMEIRNCPLSQVVADWNRVAARDVASLPKEDLLLRADSERAHGELDLLMELKGTSAVEACRIALGALHGIDGIKSGLAE